jgi:hypothetical protein
MENRAQGAKERVLGAADMFASILLALQQKTNA